MFTCEQLQEIKTKLNSLSEPSIVLISFLKEEVIGKLSFGLTQLPNGQEETLYKIVILNNAFQKLKIDNQLNVQIYKNSIVNITKEDLVKIIQDNSPCSIYTDVECK